MWGEYFLPSLDSTQSSETRYKMQHIYFSTGFHKWPNTSSWGSVRIFLQGYLYAVTQHLLTRQNFLSLNSLKVFWRSLAEISQYFHFVDNSNHLTDLVIRILWTLVMSISDAQGMMLTVILTYRGYGAPIWQWRWISDDFLDNILQKMKVSFGRKWRKYMVKTSW